MFSDEALIKAIRRDIDDALSLLSYEDCGCSYMIESRLGLGSIRLGIGFNGPAFGAKWG